MKVLTPFRLVFILLFLGILSHADTLITEAQLTNELKLYEHLSTLKVDFTQKKELKSMGVELKAKGKLSLFRKKKTVVWQITDPAPLTVTFDEHEIKIESGTAKDLQTQSFKLGSAPSDQGTKSLSSLIAWLNLDAKELYQEYQIYQTGKASYRFEPRNSVKSPFKKLEMTMDSKKQIQKLLLLEKSEDTLEIDFGKPTIQ